MNQLKSPKAASTNSAAANVSSEQLLNGRKQLNILHNGETYTLRITGNNKLILTK